MQTTDIGQFIDYYQNVRARTRRLLPLVPPDQLEWTYRPGKFTLGDLFRHIAAIERFLYVEVLFDRPSRYAGCGPELARGYDATAHFFDRCHAETLEQLRSLPPERLQQKCCPLGAPASRGGSGCGCCRSTKSTTAARFTCTWRCSALKPRPSLASLRKPWLASADRHGPHRPQPA